MYILDVALSGEAPTLFKAAEALSAWYWLVKKVPLAAADLRALPRLTRDMWNRFAKFTAFGVSLRTWKMHCAATKIKEIVDLYGSWQHVSTDAYERAHKAHKAVFHRYADSYTTCTMSHAPLTLLCLHLTHNRSNHADVPGDVARDIVRKRKIQLALGLSPLEKKPTAAARGEDGGDEGDKKKAKRRAMRRRCWMQQHNPTADGVTLGSRAHADPVEIVRVDDVDGFIPNRAQLPLLRLSAFRFADRLGWFLTDGQARRSGTYPRPDGDIVNIFRRTRVSSGHAWPGIVRASAKFHGRPVYSFVEIDVGAGVQPWYAQVLLLFTCSHHGQEWALALVAYLDAVPNSHGRAFRWFGKFPDCVQLRRIRRSVLMVVAPGCDGVHWFHLIDHDPD